MAGRGGRREWRGWGGLSDSYQIPDCDERLYGGISTGKPWLSRIYASETRLRANGKSSVSSEFVVEIRDTVQNAPAVFLGVGYVLR